MDAHEVIERFCSLQGKVSDHLGWKYAADCFCRGGGYWLSPSAAAEYGPTYEDGYRNDGKALEFIEAAVAEKIARENARSPGRGCRHE